MNRGGDATTSRILVAGIGNIFFGDDGFGPEVIRRIPGHWARPGVRFVDYGIRGMHLAYDLLDGYTALVLVDAVPDQGAPGTLHVFDADHEGLRLDAGLDAHAMDPAAVFAGLAALGGTPPRTVVIGCEAGVLEDGIGLSDTVAASIEPALGAVEAVVADLLNNRQVVRG